jgi:putative transcriptional regulator
MNNSLRGQFLVAGPKMRDPNFFKSAVLIVEHGPDGTMGLIVNHPSSFTVAHALQGYMNLPENQDLVYCGGPVEPDHLFVVHNSATLDPTEMPVVSGVFMGSSTDIFEDILQASLEDQEGLVYRVFAGCAGWGPEQLEAELSRGDWLTISADADFIFHDDPYQIWDNLITKSYAAKRILPIDCDHPEWN